MTPFDYKEQKPTGFACLMLIWAIVIFTPLRIRNTNKRKTNWILAVVVKWRYRENCLFPASTSLFFILRSLGWRVRKKKPLPWLETHCVEHALRLHSDRFFTWFFMLYSCGKNKQTNKQKQTHWNPCRTCSTITVFLIQSIARIFL